MFVTVGIFVQFRREHFGYFGGMAHLLVAEAVMGEATCVLVSILNVCYCSTLCCILKLLSTASHANFSHAILI